MDTRGFNEKDITESLDKITNAIKATGGELPPVTSDDNGKILKVVNGDWNKGPAPTELPEVSGTDNGKILTVAEGVWSKGDVPTELPAVSGTDNGKVLTVVEGVWDKATASGGGDDFYKITFSYDPDAADPPSTLACDKTFSEIQDAWSSGKTLIYKITTPLSVGWSSDMYSGFCVLNEDIVEGEPHLNSVKAITDSFWSDNEGVLSMFHMEIIYGEDDLRLYGFNWEST